MDPPTTLERPVTLKVAAELIPFVNAGALRDWLRKHPEVPARLAWMGSCKQRILYMSEVAYIRSKRVRPSTRSDAQPSKKVANG